MKRISRLLVAGIEGPRLDAATRSFLARVAPGGVILFARNVESLAGVAALVGELKALDPELLVAIDQEGGAVDRLRPHLPGVPSALALGLAGDPAYAHRAGELTGEALAALGIDLDFAPVADLALGGADNAVGLRSFGSEPEPAAAHAGAFLAGLESRGVAGCLKHFPGLGQALVDSHLSLPVIPASRDDLEAADLAAFRELVPRAAAVMVSHGYYPHVTTRGAFPATLSDEVVTGLLKEQLGFAGVAATDDLVMGALATEEIGAAAVKAVAAGGDMVLVCEDPVRIERAGAALADAVQTARLPTARLHDALARLEGLRARLARARRRAVRPAPDGPAAGGGGDLADAASRLETAGRGIEGLAREVAARTVSHLRRTGLVGRMEGPVVVVRPRVRWLSDECRRPGAGSPFAAALAEARLELREEALYDGETADADVAPLVAAEPPPGAFLLATWNAHLKPRVAPAAARLARRAPLYHLALGWPADLPDVALGGSVATLGCGFEAVAEGTRALLGLVKPRGTLVV